MTEITIAWLIFAYFTMAGYTALYLFYRTIRACQGRSTEEAKAALRAVFWLTLGISAAWPASLAWYGAIRPLRQKIRRT